VDEFVFLPDRPLERCKGETQRANQALRDYVFMGPGRSLVKLARQYKQKISDRSHRLSPDVPTVNGRITLEVWSRKYAWQARLAAWEQQQAIEDQRKWQERRDALREDEWQIGSELLELVKAMLAAGPRFIKTSRRVTRDGREVITVELNGKFLVGAAETASKLRRLATGMDANGRTTTLNIDMSQLTDAQVERIANGEDPLAVLADSGQG